MKIISVVCFILLTVLTAFMLFKFVKLHKRVKTIKARGATLTEQDMAFISSTTAFTGIICATFLVTLISVILINTLL